MGAGPYSTRAVRWDRRPAARAGAGARTAFVALLGTLSLALPAEALGAPRPAAEIGAKRIVVTARDGSSAVVERDRVRISFADPRGRTVLSSAPDGSAEPVVRPPVARSQFATFGAPPPTSYAPIGFFVGSRQVEQVPAGLWSGNLQSVTVSGTAYVATRLAFARRAGKGVELTFETSDPTGRRLIAELAPARDGSFRISTRVDRPEGVATMFGSFAAAPGEAFHGFGGRHNSLDQRGTEFYNWVQQQNLSSGSADGLTQVSPEGGPAYLFPNGEHAAYYVQSQFVSPRGYAFLLDEDEISHWRMASDRDDAWQVESYGPSLDYLVSPGRPPRAIGKLTRITGRHMVPPRWAAGTIYDRLVLFPTQSAESYRQQVAEDIANFDRYDLPLSAYRIEGWEFMSDAELAGVIDQLRDRGIKPMVYFRAFVGKDEIGTDDPAAFDEAVARGLVATRADGSPYIFTSNFNEDAAMIDFTDPEAVAWWQERVRRALELGAEGFMQDFGEQVFEDMHFASGETGVTMHNRLPVLFHRATRQVVRRFERENPGRGIFYFTRAGYSGSPGSPAHEFANFPGDETTDWARSAGIASLTTDMLNRAVGGAYGFTTDIGGYFDVGPYSATTKELFLRWAQWAALSPMFRLHGSVLNGVHAPWTFDEETVSAYKRLSRLHLRARPLIMRLWKRARRTGMPVARPLWLAYPGDREAARQDQQWLLGPKVLVAPVVEQGLTEREVYFPKGCWQSRQTGKRYRGPATRTVPAPLKRLPYFFRCGTRPFGPLR